MQTRGAHRRVRRVRTFAVGVWLVVAAASGCAGTEDGFVCEADVECEGMLALPGACWTSACVAGRCQAVERPDGSACDDGDLCTVASACRDGACEGGASPCADEVACTSGTCDPATGACRWTLDDGACDDGDPCTTDRCELTGCASALVPELPCDDGDACTDGDTCGTGGCHGTPRRCDDGGPCRPGRCEVTPSGAECRYVQQTPGFPCALAAPDPCLAAVCDEAGACGVPVACPAAGACRIARCVSGTGCIEEPGPDGAACETGDACALDGACQAGTCRATSTVACDDTNGCTADTCDPLTGACRFAPTAEGQLCADEDPCTVGTRCTGGVCGAGSAVDCDDGRACTVDACAAGACVSVPVEGATCDDDDPCTADDRCDAGGACGGAPVVDGTPCPSADPCAVATCQAGTCTPAPRDCDDDDACTDDACDPATGTCGNTPVDDGTACGADGPCVVAGACVDGACVGASTLADGTACDDARFCTEGDHCEAGLCTGTAVACSDGDSCTDDVCLEPRGCTASPSADGTPCDDGAPCTEGETCTAGLCGGGGPVFECCETDSDCDDRFRASYERCDPTTARCLRRPTCDAYIQDECHALLVTSAEGECVMLPNRHGEWVAWALDMEEPSLAGMRVYPAGSWVRDTTTVYDGLWALATAAAGWVDLPPINLVHGLSSFELRYHLEGDTNGCESGALVVELDGEERLRLCGNTGPGFLRAVVPLDSSARVQGARLRLRWTGGSERAVVDTLRFHTHAWEDCDISHTFEIAAPAPRATWLDASAFGSEGHLLWLAPDATGAVGSAWGAAFGADGRPVAAGRLVDFAARPDWRPVGHAGGVTTSPGGLWFACPAVDAEGLRCFVGTRAFTSEQPALAVGAPAQGAAVLDNGIGWLLAAARGDDPASVELALFSLLGGVAAEAPEPLVEAGPVLAHRLVRLDDGAPLLVWMERTPGPCAAIRARRLPTYGEPAGPPIALHAPESLVMDETLCPIETFDAAPVPGGGLALVWAGHVVGAPEAEHAVYRQTFDAALAPLVAAPLPLTARTTGASTSVTTAVAGPHMALAAWGSQWSATEAAVRVVRYDPSDDVVATEADLALAVDGAPLPPAVRALVLDSGYYAVVYQAGAAGGPTVRLFGVGCDGYEAERVYVGEGGRTIREVCVGDGWRPMPRPAPEDLP